MEGKRIDVVERQIQDYVQGKRPPENIRDKLDLGYSYENFVLEIYEVRPMWNNPHETLKSSFVKTRYIKSKSIWKIYWMRASGKWESYAPHPEVSNLADFFKVLDEDTHGAFWG